MLKLSKSVQLNLKIMTFMGLWKGERYKNSKSYLLYSAFVFIFFQLYPPLMTTINVLMNEKDLNKMVEHSFVTLHLLVIPVRILPLLCTNKVNLCIDHLENKMFNSYNPRDKDIIIKCTDMSIFITKSLISLCVATAFVFSLQLVFNVEEKIMLFDMLLPYDAKQSNLIFILTNIYAIMGIYSAAFTNGSIDTLLTALAMHGTAQIKILKRELTHLGERAEEIIRKNNLNSRDKNDIIYKKIIDCVKHQGSIVTYVKLFEGAVASILFSQFIMCSIVLCLCIFLLTVMPFSVSYVLVIFFLCCIISEIFLFCYFGTEFTQESSRITEAIYLSDWCNFDKKSKKALILLMECTKSPMKITIANILDISLETFSSIMKKGYSLFAVLRKMNAF